MDPTSLGLDLTGCRAVVPTSRSRRRIRLTARQRLSKSCFPIGYARIRWNALCKSHQCDIEIVRAHIDVDHPLNNNRIAAGTSPPRSKEGATMRSSHLADPISARETLCQNMIHNQRIVGGLIGTVPLFPDSARCCPGCPT